MTALAGTNDTWLRYTTVALVRKVQEAIGDESTLLLLAAPEAIEDYPRIGFNKVNRAWEIPRKR